MSTTWQNASSLWDPAALLNTYHEIEIETLVKSAVRFYHELTVYQGLAIVACLYWTLTSWSAYKRVRVPGAPVHGYWSWFEPTWFMQLRYAFTAHNIISSGYLKYKEKPFVLRRQDLDITVLPNKYLAELRTIPNSKLSRGKANFMEWGDQWAMNTLWSHSEVPIKAISENKNDQMGKYLEAVRKELPYALEQEIPDADDWTSIDVQHLIQKILARLVGKMIVGNPACRSDEWMNLAENFTEDFVTASIIMRLLPKWLHPFVTDLIPQRRRLRRHLKEVSRITDPCIARHEEYKAKKAQGLETDEEPNMLAWILDNIKDQEYVRANLAQIVVVMLVPAAHTTAMGISNLLFDLCSNLKWDAELHEEIVQVNKQYGPVGETLPMKEWVSKLELLDSFFNESQRLSQPLAITPNRYAVEEVTFKDGLRIPKGALLGWVSIHNQIDAEIAPEPEVFDPLRSYRKRQASALEATRNLAGQPSLENLSFGYGSQACPGRNIAVAILKLVVSKVLGDYEFKFDDGQAKPKNIYLLEFIIPDPKARLMMRKRK